MGKTKLGTMGDISGKVGKVVGSKWNGIQYFRAIPNSVKNPNTLAQQEQRLRFKITANLMNSLAPVLSKGFPDGIGRTPVNRAVSFNINRIITGEFPDFEIDYTQLVLSRGNLTPIYDAEVDGDTYQKVIFNWVNLLNVGDAKGDDTVVLVILNTDKNVPVFVLEGFTRQDETAEIDLPASFAGDTFEAYLIVSRADGSKVADSKYVGQFTAAAEPVEP